MKKIGICTELINVEQIEQLRELAMEYGYQVVTLDMEDGKMDPAMIDCEALMGVISTEHLPKAVALKWLHIVRAGVEDYLPDALYANPDAILTNSSGAFGVAISEYMICGLLMLQRRMIEHLDNQRKHLWVRGPGLATLYGSRVMVIGTGDLGSNFARRCQAMGADVTGIRRNANAPLPDGFDRAYSIDELDQHIGNADVVALCLPATGATDKMMDAARIAKMKRSAILINVGRGSTVDEAALAKALQRGEIGGAVLDVADPEPMHQDNPLWDCPNTIVTPHISGIDKEALSSKFLHVIYKDNLTRYLTGQPLKNIVDRKRGY